MEEELNKEFEEWANQICEELEKYYEEEERRIIEAGLITCIVYKDELWDVGFNLPSGSFEIKKEELKDYIYREEIDCFRQDEKYYFTNRLYKYMYTDNSGCAIFYRNY